MPYSSSTQSWAGFVTSILLVVSYLRGVFGVDVYGEVKNRAARLTLWAGFLACQLVVMGAKIALKTYKLPIEPSQLKNFDDFHKKYGKYIVDAGN